MSARGGAAARWALVAIVLGFGGLGATWGLDRLRGWETPRWTPERFAPLRGERVPGPGRHGLVMVAVNTGCPHCLASLAALGDSLEPRRAGGRAPRLVALVVDAPERPGPRELARVSARFVAWDSAGVWRGRWGRRLYGDVLRFDARGRWMGRAAPGDGGNPAEEAGPRDAKGGEGS